MSKLELIVALRNEARITKTEAGRVANLFFDTMADALKITTSKGRKDRPLLYCAGLSSITWIDCTYELIVT